MKGKITMKILKAVTRSVAETDSLDSMAAYLAQRLVSSLDLKGCAIFFFNPDAKELELLASFGLSHVYLTKGPLLTDKSIGETLKGEPIILQDVSQHSALQYPEDARKEGIAAIASIPIIFSKEVIGAMRLYHHQVWDIAESDIDSLQILAEMIGVAMSYARLRNAVQSVYEVVRKVCPVDPKPTC